MQLPTTNAELSKRGISVLTSMLSASALALGEVNVQIHAPKLNPAWLRSAVFLGASVISDSLKVNPTLSSIEGASSAMLGSEALKGANLAKVLEDARSEEMNMAARIERPGDIMRRDQIEDLKNVMNKLRPHAEAVFPKQYNLLARLVSDSVELKDLTWLGAATGFAGVMLGLLGQRRGARDPAVPIDDGGDGGGGDPPPPPGDDNDDFEPQYAPNIVPDVVPTPVQNMFAEWSVTAIPRIREHALDLVVPVIGAGMVGATGISMGLQYSGLGTILTGGLSATSTIGSSIATGLISYTNNLRREIQNSSLGIEAMRRNAENSKIIQREAKAGNDARKAEEKKIYEENLENARVETRRLDRIRQDLGRARMELFNTLTSTEAQEIREGQREENIHFGDQYNVKTADLWENRREDSKFTQAQLDEADKDLQTAEKKWQESKRREQSIMRAQERKDRDDDSRAKKKQRSADNTKFNDDYQRNKKRARDDVVVSPPERDDVVMPPPGRRLASVTEGDSETVSAESAGPTRRSRAKGQSIELRSGTSTERRGPTIKSGGRLYRQGVELTQTERDAVYNAPPPDLQERKWTFPPNVISSAEPFNSGESLYARLMRPTTPRLSEAERARAASTAAAIEAANAAAIAADAPAASESEMDDIFDFVGSQRRSPQYVYNYIPESESKGNSFDDRPFQPVITSIAEESARPCADVCPMSEVRARAISDAVRSIEPSVVPSNLTQAPNSM